MAGAEKPGSQLKSSFMSEGWMEYDGKAVTSQPLYIIIGVRVNEVKMAVVM